MNRKNVQEYTETYVIDGFGQIIQLFIIECLEFAGRGRFLVPEIK